MKMRLVFVLEQNYKDDLKLLKNSLKSIDSCIPTLYKQYSDLCEPGGVRVS